MPLANQSARLFCGRRCQRLQNGSGMKHRKRSGVESLVPAFLEEVDAPLAFRLLNGADLHDWQAGKPNSEFDQLVERVAELLGSCLSLLCACFVDAPAVGPAGQTAVAGSFIRRGHRRCRDSHCCGVHL